MLLQLRDSEGLSYLFVRLLASRVDVLPHCALEDEGSLRDDGDVAAQSVQAHPQGVGSPEFVLRPLSRLADPEERLDDGGLARTCAADDAHLLACLDAEIDVLEHQRQLFSVSHG